MSKMKKVSMRQKLIDMMETTDMFVKGKTSLGKGVYLFGQSYFYRIGSNPAKIQEKVEKILLEHGITDFTCIDKGDHFAQFCGGSKQGSAKDSFLWVIFKIA